MKIKKFEIIGECPICGGNVEKREIGWTMDGGEYFAWCGKCRLRSARVSMFTDKENERLMEEFCKSCEKRMEKMSYKAIMEIVERFKSEQDKWIEAKFKEFYNSDNKIEYLVESGIMTKEVAENVMKAPSIRSFCIVFEEYLKLAYERNIKNGN